MKKISSNCCLFLLLVIIQGALLLGCSNKWEVTEVKSSITIVKEIALPENLEFSSVRNSFQPIKKEYVYFYNFENGVLFVFYLRDLRLERINKFICDVDDFLINDDANTVSVIKNDSLFTFAFTGELLKSVSIPRTTSGYLFYMPNAFSPSTNDNTAFYFNHFADFEETYKDARFFATGIECCWIPSENKVTVIPVTYPQNYLLNCYGYDFMPTRIVLNKNLHGYLFSYNDSMITYDVVNHKKESHFLGSRRNKHVNGIPFDSLPNYNENVYSALVNQNPNYFFTHFLSNHGIICRYFMPNEEQEATTNEWSIILYDTEYQYIGETEIINYGISIFDTKDDILEIKISNNKLICSKIHFSF